MNAQATMAALRTSSKRFLSPGALVTYLTLGTGMSMQLLTLLTGAMSARLLGVEGRGEFAAVTLLPTLIAALGDLGGPIAYTYLSAEDKSRAPALAANAVAITAALGSVLVLILAGTSPLYLRNYPDLISTSIIVGAFTIPASLLAKHLNALAQGTGHMVRFNFARMLGPLVYFLSLGVLFLTDTHSVTAVVIASALGTLSVLIASLRPLWPVLLAHPRLNKNLVKRTYRYGLRAHIGNVSPLDAFRVDLMLVVFFLDARDAGLYAVAVAIAMVVRAQASTLGLVTVPAVVQQPTEVLKRQLAKKHFLGTSAFTLLVGFGMALLAEPLIRLVYGREFVPATTTARILIGAMVLASFRTALGNVLRALNAPGISSVAEVCSWLCIAAVLPLATARYGLTGAAWGVLFSYALSLVITLVLAYYRSRRA